MDGRQERSLTSVSGQTAIVRTSWKALERRSCAAGYSVRVGSNMMRPMFSSGLQVKVWPSVTTCRPFVRYNFSLPDKCEFHLEVSKLVVY
jgi:hypothetical protein